MGCKLGPSGLGLGSWDRMGWEGILERTLVLTLFKIDVQTVSTTIIHNIIPVCV
jgi:hypothetical protein